MRLKSRHLLGIDGMTAEEIELILDTADSLVDIATRDIKKVPTLRGKTVVNFFVEPSTRTRSTVPVMNCCPSRWWAPSSSTSR